MATELAVGRPYPLPLTQKAEGAAAQFLLKNGNLLQILLPGISEDETWSLKKGVIKAGFLYDSGCLLWLFSFYDKNKNPLLTFDCPFDATLIKRNDLALHSIDNTEQRLAIEIHTIDENRTVRALRLVTLSNKMTVNFLSAVQDQLTAAHDNNVMSRWLMSQPTELLKLCDMERLGE